MADVPKVLLTFLFVCLAWVFFRADNLTEAFNYIAGMFNNKHPSLHFFYKNSKYLLLTSLSLSAILFLILIEWNNVKNSHYEIQLSKRTVFILILMIFFMGAYKNPMSFIYFQF